MTETDDIVNNFLNTLFSPITNLFQGLSESAYSLGYKIGDVPLQIFAGMADQGDLIGNILIWILMIGIVGGLGYGIFKVVS